MERICATEKCGEDISHRPHQTRYCEDCNQTRKLLLKRESAQRNRGKEVEVSLHTGKRQTTCQGCGESFSVPYTKPAPPLCLFCKTDEIVARAEKPHKESLGERVNCLIVEDKPRDWFMVDGKLMAARMVI
jgi:hypothetical protein